MTADVQTNGLGAAYGSSPGTAEHVPTRAACAPNGSVPGQGEASNLDVVERVRSRHVRLAELHTEIAGVYRDLAGIQLADLPASRLMDREPSGPSERFPRLLTVHDLAHRLQCNERTVRRWREEGRLPRAVVLGGVVRWTPEAVDGWLLELEEGEG